MCITYDESKCTLKDYNSMIQQYNWKVSFKFKIL